MATKLQQKLGQAILLCLVCLSVTLKAETVAASDSPEAVVGKFMDFTKKGDHVACAALLHPHALEELKKLLAPVLDAAELAGDKNLLKLFEGAADYKSVREMTAKDFYVGFMSGVTKSNPVMFDALSKAEIDVVGHVTEKEKTAHVLYRMKVVLDGVSVSKLEVLSLEKDEGAWKTLLTGNVEGMAQMLLKRFKAKKAP